MAATADPRAKQQQQPASLHLKPWASPPPRAHHRAPSSSLPDVPGGGALRDRRRSSSSSHRRVGGADQAEDEPCNGRRMEDLRAKLMGHLRDAADRLRNKPPSPEPEAQAAPPLPLPTPPQQEVPAAARPWNLRDRKRRPSARAAAAAAAAAAATSSAWEAPPTAERAPSDDRAPFAVALTAEEVEEDIYALTGARPRRRPRKRPRVVQRQLDTLFPGLWLTEITADAYKVPEE